MFFLFSGEGPTDLGLCAAGKSFCDGEDYMYGPMTILVDRIVDERQHYSLLDVGCYGFVPKGALTDRAAEFKAAKKSLGLPGKRRGKETRYFFNNARALARIAREREAEFTDEVVAVLFRDSDGTASDGRGLWSDKQKSILDGFSEEGFFKGVPMLPKPKSEAWVLCATKNDYQNCNALEDRSGNDNSPNSLKKELEDHLGELPSRKSLCEMVNNGGIDINQLNIPSFQVFRHRLEEVI